MIRKTKLHIKYWNLSNVISAEWHTLIGNHHYSLANIIMKLKLKGP